MSRGTEVTKEEYLRAFILLEEHKICAGCDKLFKKEDTKYTIQYGNEKYWCAKCYEAIKDDW